VNITGLLNAILTKYHLKTPIPPEAQKELFISKKTSLKYILSVNNCYTFSVKSTMSVFYTAMRLGFNMSVNGSRMFVRAGSFVAMIVIVSSVAIVTKPYFSHRPLAVAISISGNAMIEKQGKEKTRLKLSDKIRCGDIITTGAGSFVIIQIGKNKMIRIQSNTSIEITTLYDNGANEINLRTGVFLSRILKLEKDESFNIRSARAIVRVRGTSFSVKCIKRECVVAVNEGSVEFTRIVPSSSIIVNAGFAAAADSVMEARKITAVESLEIQRIEDVPFQEHPGSLNDTKKSGILERVKKNDEEIDRKIRRLKVKAEVLPRTIDEIREKYGRITVVNTFSGKSYKGVVMSRGKIWKILVPGRYIKIHSNTIESTANVP
jgi:preprotein translocase subunit YajC